MSFALPHPAQSQAFASSLPEKTYTCNWNTWVSVRPDATGIRVSRPAHWPLTWYLTNDRLEELLTFLVRSRLSVYVRHIDVQNEPLHDLAGRILATFLGHLMWFPALECLNVSHTFLGEKGCHALADGIRSRPGLARLYASHCDMTSFAFDTLRDCLRLTGETVWCATGGNPQYQEDGCSALVGLLEQNEQTRQNHVLHACRSHIWVPEVLAKIKEFMHTKLWTGFQKKIRGRC